MVGEWPACRAGSRRAEGRPAAWVALRCRAELPRSARTCVHARLGIAGAYNLRNARRQWPESVPTPSVASVSAEAAGVGERSEPRAERSESECSDGSSRAIPIACPAVGYSVALSAHPNQCRRDTAGHAMVRGAARPVATLRSGLGLGLRRYCSSPVGTIVAASIIRTTVRSSARVRCITPCGTIIAWRGPSSTVRPSRSSSSLPSIT